MEEPRKAALDHSWAWFQLHAGQRMQLVNFWLVATAFITAALTTAFTHNDYPLALFVALGGAVATFGFERLEIRTRELVHLGEAALRVLQEQLAAEVAVPSLRLVAEADKHPRLLGTYRDAVRLLHWSAIGAFIGAAGFAAGHWSS